MIIDGRALASAILARVRGEMPGDATPIVRAIVMQPSPATESFLATKSARAADAGMQLEIVHVPDRAEIDDVIAAIEAPGADAVLVQLPLPAHIDIEYALNRIPLAKDADVLSFLAQDAFKTGTEGALLPPVVGALQEILASSGVDPSGKRAVVIGKGRLVGEPCAVWLRQAGAEVIVITREEGVEGLLKLKDADIVVSGAGSPALIRPEHLKPGVVLIDAGTSESSGVIVGDADPACASVASVFTPVPGGVGPVAVACLFRNASELVKRALQVG